MLLKKLFVISLCITTLSTLAQPEDKVIGNITNQNIKDFLVGAGIGAVHGAVNNSLETKGKNADNKGLYIITFVAAEGLQRNYALGSPVARGSENLATMWGHGIAQSLAEACNFEAQLINRQAINVNTELLLATIGTFLGKK